MAKKDHGKYVKSWILENGIPIVEEFGGNLTIRALHYQLVAIGMTNDIQHYKRVVDAMTYARWERLLDFDAFMDHERETIGRTKYEVTTVEDQVTEAKKQIKLWASSYRKNRWENQEYYPEIFIEKKALQGVFDPLCYKWNVALNPCKGYPSLTFLNEARQRFELAEMRGHTPIIIYFGDYDCTGEDIPRSLQDNLARMGVNVELKRVMLTEAQVRKWKLPPAPTKTTDSRGANWDGIGQVELDAAIKYIPEMFNKAVSEIFDDELYDELKAEEDIEEEKFKAILKRDFKKLLD